MPCTTESFRPQKFPEISNHKLVIDLGIEGSMANLLDSNNRFLVLVFVQHFSFISTKYFFKKMITTNI